MILYEDYIIKHALLLLYLFCQYKLQRFVRAKQLVIMDSCQSENRRDSFRRTRWQLVGNVYWPLLHTPNYLGPHSATSSAAPFHRCTYQLLKWYYVVDFEGKSISYGLIVCHKHRVYYCLVEIHDLPTISMGSTSLLYRISCPLTIENKNSTRLVCVVDSNCLLLTSYWFGGSFTFELSN